VRAAALPPVRTDTNRVQSGHLTHVKSAFNRLGYQLADNAEDDWTVMWAFHSPFHQRQGEPDVPATVRRMNEKQMVCTPCSTQPC